jgi:hypothetical protein
MKKILLFIAILFSISSYGQNRFPSIDSAKNYTLRYVKNSAVESFTNLRMQNVVYGTLQLLDSLAGAGVVDTIFKSGDTLKYKIGSTTFTVGTFGGGSTPNLQAVTDVGNTSTNGAVFNFSEGSVTIGNDGGDPYLSLTATGTGSNVTLTSQNIGIYNNTSSANNSLLLSIPSIYSNRSRTLLFPLTPSTGEKYIPLSIRLNSTTYTANDTGSIELGTIGGISGSGSANRITYWDGASSVTSNANLTTNGSNLGIGGTANASAALDVTSTTQGTRPFPTMTTTQRNAISSPATGLLIFNSTDSVQQYYNGAAWIDLSDYRLNRRTSIKREFVEEFLGTSSIFSASNSGSGSNASAVAIQSGNSTIDIDAGYTQVQSASSTGVLLTQSNSGIAHFSPRFYTNPYIFETRVIADTCNATDTLVHLIGLQTPFASSTAATNFAGFIYDPRNTFGYGTTGSRFIQCVTVFNSSITRTATSVVLKPATWTKLKMVASANYVLFYVDDVLVATHTTNLPTNSGIGYQWAFRSTKTVGTATQRMFIDYWSLEHYLDTKR